jgi:23S rRNA pseudouridine1911/1915/1917 synthase
LYREKIGVFLKADIRIEVTKEYEGMTVKTVLRRNRGVSSRLIRKIVQGAGGVFLNGAPALFIDIARAGDVIGLVFPEEISRFEPQDIPIHVLHEDDDILVIDKQPGYVVHPTKGHVDQTIANGVMKHMLDRGERYKIRFVNRLDMDTSGVLLIGKNAFAQSDFTRQADAGQIAKRYLALVEGIVLADRGTIDLPIDLAEEGKVRRAVMENGYPSVTH